MIRAILNALINNILIFLSSKGDKIMMTMFFAQRVILEKNVFEDVPATLKTGVAEILIESGLNYLVPSEFGGSKQETQETVA